jgi:hypothetical protein
MLSEESPADRHVACISCHCSQHLQSYYILIDLYSVSLTSDWNIAVTKKTYVNYRSF